MTTTLTITLANRGGATYKVDQNVWSRSRGLVASELIAQEAVKNLYGN